MDLPLEGVSSLRRAIRWFSPKRVHKMLLWVWLVGGSVLNWIMDWQYLVPWVSFMSLYAIVVGHWSGLEAAKAEEEIGYNA